MQGNVFEGVKSAIKRFWSRFVKTLGLLFTIFHLWETTALAKRSCLQVPDAQLKVNNSGMAAGIIKNDLVSDECHIHWRRHREIL